MQTIDIIRIEDGKITQQTDQVANEILLSLFINENLISRISCLGRNINELITGYLYFHGYINDYNEINSLDYTVGEEKIYVSIQKHEENPIDEVQSDKKAFKQEKLFNLMENFVAMSETFHKTGAVHSAGIATNSKIIKTFDDLSRHNAVFMLLGHCLINNETLSDKILLLTCRLTNSIMEILLKANINFILTKAAPTDLAVNICKKNDITLAGFVRGNRMNVYHGSERIVV
jgi:FdhD protein